MILYRKSRGRHTDGLLADQFSYWLISLEGVAPWTGQPGRQFSTDGNSQLRLRAHFRRPARIAGANDRVRVGLIGSGGRGREDWGNFLKQPEVEPVAVCDVYTAVSRTRHCDGKRQAESFYTDFQKSCWRTRAPTR